MATSRIEMTVDYIVDFAAEDDEAETVLLDILNHILDDIHVKDQVDGWKIVSASIREDVRKLPEGYMPSVLCPYCGGSGPKGDARWHRHDCSRRASDDERIVS